MEPSNESTPPTPSPKNKGGRPRYVPDAKAIQKVTNLIATGMPLETAADCMELSYKTFKRAFKKEIKLGRAQGLAVAFGMYTKAIANGESWAISKKLAIEGNYREIPLVQSQQLGADGKPVNPPGTTVYVIKPEELKQISEDLKDKV
jgi:hypothetical protein